MILKKGEHKVGEGRWKKEIKVEGTLFNQALVWCCIITLLTRGQEPVIHPGIYVRQS